MRKKYRCDNPATGWQWQQMLLLMLALLAVLAMLAQTAQAASFPDHDVDYIIPFSPGGETDVAARMQAPLFRQLTGHELKIHYRPGAGGATVWAQINELDNSGHTIIGTNLPHIILQPMRENAGYQTLEIQNIYWFQYTPDALLVPANSPFHTLKDFIFAAKTNPDELTVGGTGMASGNQLAQVRFNKLAGVQTSYLPYKGTGAVNTALLAGQLDAAWAYTSVRLGLGDQVRCLAVAMAQRHAAIPDCPTFRELGLDLVGGVYRGIAVPKDTPVSRQVQLAEIFRQINQDMDFARQMEEQGVQRVDIGPAGMQAFMEARRSEYEMAAHDLGLN